MSPSLYGMKVSAEAQASLLAENSVRGQLTQMLVEVQTTDNIATVNKMMGVVRGMCTRLEKQQFRHKSVHAKMLSQCLEEQSFRTKEVDEAGKAQRRSLEARSKCNDSLKASQKDLPELTNTKTTYNTELSRAQTQRNNETKRYKQRKQDYEEAIAFLKDFQSYMNAKFKGNLKSTSFIERSEKLLKHASKLGLLTEAVPVLVAIAQHEELPANNKYSFTPNENLENKLKDTLTKLLARLQHDWQANEEVESKSEETFLVYKSKLQSLINSLGASIDKTQKQIETMTKCVQEEDAISSSAGAKNARNSKILLNARSMCDRFDKEFVEATNNRLDEINTLEQILKIVKKRFGKLDPKLVAYVQSMKSGWTTYMQSAEFKNFKAYQQREAAALKNKEANVKLF